MLRLALLVLTLHPALCFAQAPAFFSTTVLNASGYQNKLAPGVIFVVFGTGLGPTTLVAADGEFLNSLAGTSITFTPVGGGPATNARLVYTSATQLAAHLPSSVAPGTYSVRITYNGITSTPQNVTVVARSFGIAAANSAGTGVAQATIGNINGGLSLTRFTSGTLAFGGYSWNLGPAHPGDTVVLWGTGGGADLANDTGGTSGDQTAAGNFKVNINGRAVTPLYAGASSGFPGLWQINFTLPTDLTPDCFASISVTTAAETSNTVIIPIAPAGQSSCVDPQLPPSALSKLDAGGTIHVGAFGVARSTQPTPVVAIQESISGFFASYTAAEWLIKISGPKVDLCSIYDRTFNRITGKDPSIPSTILEAGPRIGVTGPNLPTGANLGVIAPGPFYGYLPPAGTLSAGRYTITGTGGASVGAFTASTTFPTAFNVTNFDTITTIDRSKPLTYNWTGSGYDQVYIQLGSSTISGQNLRLVTISCYIPGNQNSYTVPSAALSYLQPSSTASASSGNVAISGISNPVSIFTAPLVAGGQLDFGLFTANIGYAKGIAIQ